MKSAFKTNKLLLIAIILILACVIGFHLLLLLLPLPGIAIAMSGAAWGVIVATITLLAIAALLFFILPGILIALLSLFAFGWVILAIALFPFLFPLILPVFIILLFIAYISRRNCEKARSKDGNIKP